jgi:CDP-6-deoxy-D-xylo-4-hexulose-3-dehydrase
MLGQEITKGELVIKVGDFRIGEEGKELVNKILNSGKVSEGKYVRQFEEMWAEFIGTKYAVLTNSGTSALMLSLQFLKSFGVKERKVLTSPLTFIATINAIVLSGFEPTFADVDRETFGILPPPYVSEIFMPVHLYGYPTDMDKFSAKWTIEDCCEAHGTLYRGKKVGSIGQMGCFSFYIAHNIQVGDMGAVTTNDPYIYKMLKKLKSHARYCSCPVCMRAEGKCPNVSKPFDPRFTFTDIAYNFKTSEFNAALGIEQIRGANDIIRLRRENVKYLNEGLAEFSDILQLPKYDSNVSYLAYPIVIKKPELITRDKMCKALEQRGVETRPFFSCVPLQQPAYEYLKQDWIGKLPNAEYLGANGFHIGCHQYLTEDNLDEVIDTFRETLNEMLP